MENMIMWLTLGVAGIVIVGATVLLQKKTGEIKRLSEELTAARQERDEKSAALEAMEKEAGEIKRLSEELTIARQERDEKRTALEKLEKEFEDKMDKVVESSIQKISHAEQAKEEAIQAAQDNYEAAAEVHALLKEKEALLNKLQKQAAS